ncbi:Isochorismatase hydrolase [Fomitopsis betulina]|nr:Isochorismatase hydrolase [Fomitopsis betulina]
MPPSGAALPNGHSHAYQHYAATSHSHPETNGRARPTPSRALLLLDVQVSRLADPPLGVPSARAVGPNIAKVLAAARACPPPSRPRIIHVRKCGAPGDPDERGLPGWALVHEPLPDEPVLDKRKNNAFTGTALADLVPPEAELVVVGLESDFCVRATCSAALARGNDVLLIRGAHATYDRIEYWDGGTSYPAEKVQREIEEELEEAGVILLEMSDLRSLYDDR